MPREYRSIQEVAGPLMLVKDVEGVAYDELGEILLEDGQTRSCRVLEIDGSNALVQLFESAAGIRPAGGRVRFLGRGMELGVSEDLLGRVFDGMGRPADGGPEILPQSGGSGEERSVSESGGGSGGGADRRAPDGADGRGISGF